MPDVSQRTIILPIETKVREFHGKLLLAAVGAESGFDVVLGEQKKLLQDIRRLPRGTYVDKSISRTRVKRFQKLHRLGYRIAAWCEEGLVYRDCDTYLHERVSVESLEQTDLFFAWGDVQADAVLSKAPHAADRVVCSGNPRFDVLRPGFRDLFAGGAESLRRTHGRFILVCTNFSRFNHHHGREFVLHVLRRRGIIKTAEQEEFFREWGNYLRLVYGEFVALLPILSRAFPEYSIVIRPHPSENHGAWSEAVCDLPNVKVIHEGSVIPWILASEAVVHNSCTTGVESYLLERPVVAYRPVTHDVLDSHLPNAVSDEVSDSTELIDVIKALLAGRQVSSPDVLHKRRDCAHQYIANLDGTLAAERVIQALAENGQSAPVPKHAIASALVDSVKGFARPAVSQLRRVAPGWYDYRAYARQKFSGLELTEVKHALAELKSVTNRFAGIEAQAMPGVESGFLITRVAHH